MKAESILIKMCPINVRPETANAESQTSQFPAAGAHRELTNRLSVACAAAIQSSIIIAAGIAHFRRTLRVSGISAACSALFAASCKGQQHTKHGNNQYNSFDFHDFPPPQKLYAFICNPMVLAYRIYYHFSRAPSLSLNEPQRIMIKSTSTPTPSQPAVNNQTTPVPTFPT